MAKKKAAMQWPVMAAQWLDDSTTDLKISSSNPTSAWHQEKMLRISVIEVARNGQ